jgi:hypothetical protein
MATLADIERALTEAQELLTVQAAKDKEYAAETGGTLGGFVGPSYTTVKLSAQIERLQKAKRIAELNELAATDTDTGQEARDSLEIERGKVASNIPAYQKEQQDLDEDISELTGRAVERKTQEEDEEKILNDAFPGLVNNTPAAATPTTPAAPAAATPTTPAAPTPPSPIPTRDDVTSMREELESERELRDTEAKAKKRALEDAQREKDRVLRDEAYNRMTPAERLQENVRERVAQKMANAAGAVAERREQMAADEEYKAQQIASKGYFRDGDTTQYVDATERESAIEYYKARAEDIITGGSTAGAAPRFEGDRSLTVVDIDYLHRPEGDKVGKGISHSPTFGGTGPAQAGSFFGPDPNLMQYQTIDGRQIPIMTGNQAFETQRVGQGINQYEKKGSIAEQLDARAARDIRLQQGNITTQEKIDYARTGKLPARMTPKAIEEERKRRAGEKPPPKPLLKPPPKSLPKPVDGGRGTPV